MQSAGDIQPCCQRQLELLNPARSKTSTSIGYADDQCTRALGDSIRYIHVRQAKVGVTARQS
jgi:hypothetical protein